jgi:acetyl esterase/lipase
MKTKLFWEAIFTALLVVNASAADFGSERSNPIGTDDIAPDGAYTADFNAAGRHAIETYGIAPDGAVLQWVVHTPRIPGPWPMILLIHGGGFSSGSATELQVSAAADDLANAGYLALSITYRLDVKKILNQQSDGTFPQQTDDCKMAVLAARGDRRGNGKVGVLGASAGGSHAVWISSTGVPGYDKADVAVSLSGPCLFSDFGNPPIGDFINKVTRYVNCQRFETDKLNAASPAMLATLADASPMLLCAARHDTLPPTQIPDMTAALDAAGNDSYAWFIYEDTLDHHSWDYWFAVKNMSIAWFDAVLKP